MFLRYQSPGEIHFSHPHSDEEIQTPADGRRSPKESYLKRSETSFMAYVGLCDTLYSMLKLS